MKVSLFEIKSAADLPGAFDAAAQQNVQALLLFDMPYLSTRATAAQIAELSTQKQIPMMFQVPVFVQEGGLISYGVKFTDLNRKAATYVDRILKGAKPGDLPIEQPTTFDLVLNLKTAKQLGITIAQAMRVRATEVIE